MGQNLGGLIEFAFFGVYLVTLEVTSQHSLRSKHFGKHQKPPKNRRKRPTLLAKTQAVWGPRPTTHAHLPSPRPGSALPLPRAPVGGFGAAEPHHLHDEVDVPREAGQLEGSEPWAL